MFQVVKKFKVVKTAMKDLNKEGFHDIHAVELKPYHALIDAQKPMLENTGNIELVEAEINVVKEYRIKHQAHIDFLSQKAKKMLG